MVKGFLMYVILIYKKNDSKRIVNLSKNSLERKVLGLLGDNKYFETFSVLDAIPEMKEIGEVNNKLFEKAILILRESIPSISRNGERIKIKLKK